MRIISGLHKGRKILPPKNLPVRPTTDFAKEALFNILRSRLYFDEIRCLDLFSGTGSISFELASRGVPSVVAVDVHHGCIRFIGKISKDLELPVEAVQSDVFRFLENHSSSYQLIFADPPYDFEYEKFEELINLIFEMKLLTEDGVLIVEHTKRMDLSGVNHFSESRKYGDSTFSFFESQQ